MSETYVEKVAVIGLGSIGLRHARHLLDVGARVIGYDPSPQRAIEFASLGGAVAKNAEQAIKSASRAIVASPSPLHLEHLEAAISLGRPVLVEKPLAVSIPGVESAIKKAHDASIPVMVGFHLRFHSAVRTASDLIEDGRIGDHSWSRFVSSSYLPEWRPGEDHRTGYANDPASGGVIFDLAHEFDLALHLGGPFSTIAADATQSGQIGIQSDDMADILLKHTSGCRSSLHLDYLTRPRIREADIVGTNGRLRLDLVNRRLSVFGLDELVETQSWPTTPDDDYRSQIRAFLSTCPPTYMCTGEQALLSLNEIVTARRLCGLPSA